MDIFFMASFFLRVQAACYKHKQVPIGLKVIHFLFTEGDKEHSDSGWASRINDLRATVYCWHKPLEKGTVTARTGMFE